MNCFSKYLIDRTITVHLHHMCCRILLNLLDCIKEKQDSEVYNARELTLKILEIIVTKFEAIAKTQMPYYMMENKKFVFSLSFCVFLFQYFLQFK
jgi:transformation/transcription domain-associated protein